MDLLIVGSVAFDDIRTPYGQEDNILGGSATFSSISASRFVKTGIVGVVGKDFPDEHVNLFRSCDVDTAGLMVEEGKTFHWKGYYEGDMAHAHTVDTQLGVFAGFNPKLPEVYRDAPFVFLGNIHPSLQLAVLDQVRKPHLVGADSMNLWINTTRDELEKVIRRVDLMFLNDAEARAIAGEFNLNKAAHAILEKGPKVVIIKRGENGASIHTRDICFWAPAVPLTEVYDPTGAGDTFAGGLMGYLAMRGQSALDAIREGAVIGNVLASFTVEDFSVRGLLKATPQAIRDRYELIRQQTTFGDLLSRA